MKIARVFPRVTNATPHDDMAFFDGPPLWPVECDEVHVSVAFTYDLTRAKALATDWSKSGYDVRIGGPGTGQAGEAFTPGRYLKRGYVITSRGCPNRCWFCSVWKRDGNVRQLPITDGWDVLDDNLLACSEPHIRAVFDMLNRQPKKARFTGGLEAKRMTPAIAEGLRELVPETLYFAYDTPDDFGPMCRAADMLWAAGFPKKHRSVRAYVLCGFKGDTQEKAEARLVATLERNIVPMCMMWRDADGRRENWSGFQRRWVRPALIPLASS
jgi:hypothetical protein